MIRTLAIIFGAISILYWGAFFANLFLRDDDQPLLMMGGLAFQLFAMLLWGRRS